MDRGAWQTTVHGVAKESDTTERLNNNAYHKLGGESVTLDGVNSTC